MLVEELKRTTRAIDLAVAAGKKRQSPRTGFLHYFPKEDVSDTIPIYENFCFALALFRQKTSESVLEGKELIERLLAFQGEDGNFPVYLHDFPKCWDFHQALKIAPILVHILRDFGTVLSASYKEKLESSLQKAIQPPKNPSWEHRYLALLGKTSSVAEPTCAQEWFEWIISKQLLEKDGVYPIAFDRTLQAFLGGPFIQEKGEPQPQPIEYLLAEKEGFSKRLTRDHPNQIYSSQLFPFSSSKESSSQIAYQSQRMLWHGDTLHSLISHNGRKEGNSVVFELVEGVEIGRNDLFEALFYCDISPETSIFINDQKGMVFYFGDTISIRSPALQIDLRFELEEGEGDFCGHISRSNRAGQVACLGANLYEAYDWQIGMRTLRRSGACKIRSFIRPLA